MVAREVSRKQTVMFTGGGSGGHIIPGIAVARLLQAMAASEAGRELAVIWLSTHSLSEQKLINAAGIETVPILSGKLRRYRSLKNLLDIIRIAAALFQSLLILRKYRPVLLFSKGGYVSVPPVFAARILGIPVIIHDSDTDPALTTRLCANAAKRILIPYEESAKSYAEKYRHKLSVTGNPIRSGIDRGDRIAGKLFCGFPETEQLPVLLVVGGSKGARRLNELIAPHLPELCTQMFVIHITGDDEPGHTHTNYAAFSFVDEAYPDLLALANLVVTRGGAGALWECAVCGKPMIILPKSRENGSRGDQERNAMLFAEHGAAMALDENKVDAESLKNAILRVIGSQERLQSMAEQARSLCNRDADRLSAEVILEVIGGRG